MLVCSVSLQRRSAPIVADVAEIAAAVDATAIGNIVFATLVDDPTAVNDHIDAFVGQIMLEAASAAASVSAGFGYNAAVVETANAADVPAGSMMIAVPFQSMVHTLAGPVYINHKDADRVMLVGSIALVSDRKA